MTLNKLEMQIVAKCLEIVLTFAYKMFNDDRSIDELKILKAKIENELKENK